MSKESNVDDYSAQDGLGYCLSRAATIVQTAVEEALLEVDLSRLSWVVLACIRFDGIQSPSKIAAFTGLERSSTSRLISRLEELGYVVRETNSIDGRGYRVKPTRSGIKICNKAPVIIRKAMRPYLADFSDNDLRLLTDLLKRVGTDEVSIWKTDTAHAQRDYKETNG